MSIKIKKIRIKEVEACLKGNPTPSNRKRLKILLLYAKGCAPKEIGRKAQVASTAVYGVLKTYNVLGIRGVLRGIPVAGNRICLNKKQMKEVASWIGNPRSIDYFYTVGDCRKMVIRIRKKWGIKVDAKYLYLLLRQYRALL